MAGSAGWYATGTGRRRDIQWRLHRIGKQRIGGLAGVRGREVLTPKLHVDIAVALTGIGVRIAETAGRTDWHLSPGITQHELAVPDAAVRPDMRQVTEQGIERAILEHQDDPVADPL